MFCGFFSVFISGFVLSPSTTRREIRAAHPSAERELGCRGLTTFYFFPQVQALTFAPENPNPFFEDAE